MATGTCFRPKEEQLYMLELLVDRLNLNPEKVQEVGTTPLCCRLKFIDFPIFEISQEEFVSSKKKRDKEIAANPAAKTKDGSVDFSTGKSCLFPKQPRDLVQAMQSRPLKVGIYKMSDKPVCGILLDIPPVCETQVPLSGCLCDQVAMAMNDADHLPKPYTLKNTYNLIDGQSRPSGTIAVFLRLSCFGKSIVTHFAFQDKSFLFKSSHSQNEFQCTRVPPDEEELAKRAKEVKDKICIPEGYKEPEVDPPPKPQDVVGLAPICQELAKRDGGPLEIIPSMMGDPGPDKPTDRDYEGLVYRAFPNDPTCACPPDGNYLKTLAGPFPCSGAGCSGSLCVGTRLLDPPPRDHHGGSEMNPCYTGSCCAGPGSNLGCCGTPRMRGGGCCGGGGGKPAGNSSGGGNTAPAMGGGPKFSCYGGGANGPATQSMDTLISGACKSPLGGGSNGKSGCCCLGKTGGGEMNAKPAMGTKKGAACTKKPCLGIDCLIRAFKETQDFVDSIGKVPGLAGLGLMDPSESPYFGRERENVENSNSCAARKPPVPPPQLSNGPNSQCPGPCNTQTQTKPQVAGTGSATAPISTASPFSTTVTGRTGAAREPTPAQMETLSIASARVKKKDEKSDKQKEQEVNLPPPPDIETGPCGEPKCKSRRKKTLEEPISEVNGRMSVVKKSLLAPKPMSGGSSRGGSGGKSVDRDKDKGKGQAKTKPGSPGPAGDRNMATNSYIKVSKRIMRFVYSTGTRYPGINYGHKNCLDSRMRVPANMGWLWNTNTMPGKIKPCLGWKPGAISKYLYDLLTEAKAGSGSVESRPSSTPTKGKKGKVAKSKSFQSMARSQRGKKKEGENEEIELPPTLHIHRKDGTYYVTMYPIKQETMGAPQLEEPAKPLQFKITKNKDDASVCSSSTASDMEIEFSPPAAVNRYRKKPDVTHIDTQVKQQEILDAFKPPGGGKGKKGKKGKGKK